jgi:hypothetical protein
MSRLYIGIGGLARSGKDIFCKIARNILSANGYTSKRYAFADALKGDVAPFLREKCGVDVWTDDTSIKTDIRDFLVWYGTTFWRKRDDNKWINIIEKNIETDPENVQVALISDVRYPNEAKWIKNKNGFFVHLSKFITINDGSLVFFQRPPNEQEKINDPLISDLADACVKWSDVSITDIKITPEELVKNTYLKEEVFKSLQVCPGLSLTRLD